ncbi:S-layer homology domain-containing protein [Acutalibacter sp. LFL-21]|uniref:S-layer homology domain-containing protein n=1 Tax=Acutalibacter sp. LFL-21 TaxID=2983399 RepID=UPI0021D65DA2|nr:S-layer homology domain-containing protein [Acutalibacter sp. LFL-21]MCU7651610.1 S-layer homology domain-containing protein [Acutalibacter sp. LFL-21]
MGSETVEADGTSFSATYGTGATTVQVTQNLPTGVDVVAVQKNGYTTDSLTSGTAATLTLSNYIVSENVYTIPIKVSPTANGSYAGNESVTYTLTLSPETLSTENGIEKVAVNTTGTNAGVLSASLDSASHEVDVVVAYGYTAGSGQIVVTPVETANAGSGAGKDHIVSVTNNANFTVAPEAGESVVWTVKVTEVPAITALSVAGVDGVFSDESNPKDNKNETITVTLDPEDIENIEAEADGTTYKLPVVYSVLANTTVSNSAGSFDSGEEIDFATLKTAGSTQTITVANGSASMTYNLKVSVTKSNDNSVQAIWVNGIPATANGNKFDVTLDDGTTLSGSQKVTIRVAKGATVEANALVADTTPSDTTNDEYDEYYYTTTALDSTLTFNVVAADKTSKQYTLTAKVATATSDATLTSFTLEAPDGTQYNTTISNNTITTAPIPYMTTSIADWTMIAATSDGSRALLGSTAIRNRETEFSEGSLTGISGWTDGEKKTISNAVTVKSQGADGTVSTYNLVITFANASTNNTLSGVEVTAQNPTAGSTEKDVVEAMENSNTYKASVDATNKTITIKTAWSHRQDSYAGNYYVSDLTTGGGVAYAYTSGTDAVTKITALDGTKDTGAITASNLKNITKIIVLPETAAKVIDGTPKTTLDAGMAAAGTIYDVKWDKEAASTEASMSAISVGDTKLSLTSAAGGVQITGTIPYGLTVDEDDTLTEDNTYFLNYTISNYASLSDGTNAFNVNGIPEGETEAQDADTDNAKVAFVRAEDNKVVVKVWTGASQTAGDATALSKLVVTAENTTAKNDYSFNLKHANANTGAELTSFKLGNISGSISGQNITVALPFGANLYGQVATFTTSEGAEVYLGSVNPSNLLTSGESVLNVSSPVTLKVQSEAGNRTVSYTLKATTADQFSDVDTNDWYYNNVMRAVELGILSGYSDGTFKPMNNITRRDFAIMLAQSLGHDNDEEATSPFKDVADTDYGVSSIAYLYENEITVGDSNGNFNPDANITRQEAAIMLVKAFEATGTSSDLYADDAQIASWAKSFVYTAKAAGLMKGDDHNEFNPTDRLTRAEAASAMVNAVDN